MRVADRSDRGQRVADRGSISENWPQGWLGVWHGPSGDYGASRLKKTPSLQSRRVDDATLARSSSLVVLALAKRAPRHAPRKTECHIDEAVAQAPQAPQGRSWPNRLPADTTSPSGNRCPGRHKKQAETKPPRVQARCSLRAAERHVSAGDGGLYPIAWVNTEPQKRDPRGSWLDRAEADGRRHGCGVLLSVACDRRRRSLALLPSPRRLRRASRHPAKLSTPQSAQPRAKTR